MKFSIRFLIFAQFCINVFNFSSSADSVTEIRKIHVEFDCKLEKRKDGFYFGPEHSLGASLNLFVCSLPSFVNLNDAIEVNSKSVRNARIWINDADIFVSIDEKGVPLKMPTGIGGQFYGMKSLRIMMSPLREIERENFKRMEELRNLHLVRKLKKKT